MTQQRFIGFQSIRLNPLVGFVTLVSRDRRSDEFIFTFTTITLLYTYPKENYYYYKYVF